LVSSADAAAAIVRLLLFLDISSFNVLTFFISDYGGDAADYAGDPRSPFGDSRTRFTDSTIGFAFVGVGSFIGVSTGVASTAYIASVAITGMLSALGIGTCALILYA
jgi:hypothetical protein